MRKYTNKEAADIIEMRCNLCGKKVNVQNGIVKEGVVSVDIKWGYFSDKDGQVHSFDLCEACYDRLSTSFAIPPEKEQQKELV